MSTGIYKDSILTEENLPRFIEGAKLLIDGPGCFGTLEITCHFSKKGKLCPLVLSKYVDYCSPSICHSSKDRKVSMVAGAKLFIAEHCENALEYLL